MRKLIGARGAPYYPPAGFVFTQTISTNRLTTFNLWTELLAAGWNGTQAINATITISGAWLVGTPGTSASKNGGIGFLTGEVNSISPAARKRFAVGSVLSLIVQPGSGVLGGGGDNALGKNETVGNGGIAIQATTGATDLVFYLDNQGIISGGSAASGSAVNVYNAFTGVTSGKIGGNGAPWAGVGEIGAATLTDGGAVTTVTTGGAVGSATAYPGGDMNNSGGWAENGQAGTGGTSYNTSGGTAGACVVNNSNITWINTGTRYGTIS